ncbi:ABC transporter permease [Desulfurococcus amylolyticus]|uniref:ABC transporter permease n=1 Tax=Desulfurococcus amylolyticus TaxID=94694 RepID=UPI0005B22DF3|nr:ABC transporter permease [Desulfurococcus amylolyticus]
MGLGRFLARRVATFIPTIIGVLFITYLIAYAIPADPVRAWVGEKLMNREALEEIRAKYKFDAPWYEQFAFLVTSLLTGNLEDPIQHRNIFDELFYRFPITVEVAIMGFVFTAIIGIPLGFIAALKKDSIVDFFVRIFALVGSSLPAFVLYYFLILFLFTYMHTTVLAGMPFPSQTCIASISSLPSKIPVIGHIVSAIGSVPMFGAMMCGEWGVVADTFRRLYLPGLALGLLDGGLIARIVRNSLLDSLSQEYIQYAKARGLRKRRIWMHALKNASIPVVTVLGTLFGGLLSGAIVAETVFNIPGLGRYIYNAITRLNFPAIIGGTFLVAIVYVTVNLIVDIIYAVLDPRIRY